MLLPFERALFVFLLAIAFGSSDGWMSLTSGFGGSDEDAIGTADVEGVAPTIFGARGWPVECSCMEVGLEVAAGEAVSGGGRSAMGSRTVWV